MTMGRNSSSRPSTCLTPRLISAPWQNPANPSSHINPVCFLQLHQTYHEPTSPTFSSELKKDPGVPKLPNLKTRNAEKQKTRSASLSYLDLLDHDHRSPSHLISDSCICCSHRHARIQMRRWHPNLHCHPLRCWRPRSIKHTRPTLRAPYFPLRKRKSRCDDTTFARYTKLSMKATLSSSFSTHAIQRDAEVGSLKRRSGDEKPRERSWCSS